MMALSQSDLYRLIGSLRSSDGLELVRSVAERMLQELIEAEATAVIGAGWNEHADTRTAYRNGHRDKTLTTQAGDLNLAIPQAGDTIAAGGAEDSQARIACRANLWRSSHS
jgi:putative transposase